MLFVLRISESSNPSILPSLLDFFLGPTVKREERIAIPVSLSTQPLKQVADGWIIGGISEQNNGISVEEVLHEAGRPAIYQVSLPEI